METAISPLASGLDTDYDMGGYDALNHRHPFDSSVEACSMVEESGNVTLGDTTALSTFMSSKDKPEVDVEFQDEENVGPAHVVSNTGFRSAESHNYLKVQEAIASELPQESIVTDIGQYDQPSIVSAVESRPTTSEQVFTIHSTETQDPHLQGTGKQYSFHQDIQKLASKSFATAETELNHSEPSSTTQDTVEADEAAGENEAAQDGSTSPSVRVSFNGHDFVLFSSEDTPFFSQVSQATFPNDIDQGQISLEIIPAPGLKASAELLWQPLENLFAALREKEAFGEFLQEGSELVCHFPDLELEVREDNVYCREIALDDLFQLHHGLGLTASLHIVVTEAPRFISKYNELAQHVARVVSSDGYPEYKGQGEGDDAQETQDEDSPERHSSEKSYTEQEDEEEDELAQAEEDGVEEENNNPTRQDDSADPRWAESSLNENGQVGSGSQEDPTVRVSHELKEQRKDEEDETDPNVHDNASNSQAKDANESRQESTVGSRYHGLDVDELAETDAGAFDTQSTTEDGEEGEDGGDGEKVDGNYDGDGDEGVSHLSVAEEADLESQSANADRETSLEAEQTFITVHDEDEEYEIQDEDDDGEYGEVEGAVEIAETVASDYQGGLEDEGTFEEVDQLDLEREPSATLTADREEEDEIVEYQDAESHVGASNTHLDDGHAAPDSDQHHLGDFRASSENPKSKRYLDEEDELAEEGLVEVAETKRAKIDETYI